MIQRIEVLKVDGTVRPASASRIKWVGRLALRSEYVVIGAMITVVLYLFPMENLMKLGVPDWRACAVAYSRKAYWRSARHASVNAAISNERLAQAGYYSILDQYESLHLYG